MNASKKESLLELLTKSLAFLFSIEGDRFKLLDIPNAIDPPFIYATTGVFELCLGEVIGKGIEITPYGVGGDMPTWDWRVVVFIDKQFVNKDSANVVLIKNDDDFKLKWDDAYEFAKTIKHKFWLEINDTK